MPNGHSSSGVVRFGVFEADLRTGELRKQGRRLKLQDQPFRVLTLLLQRPGDVVTRAELRSQLWQSDTFVDFDNGLNTCINKLREVLGDSADSPRFIETLPRRGYRFIAPVITVDTAAAGVTSAAVPSRGRRLIVAPVALAIALAVVSDVLLWRSRQEPRLTDKDTIVLADFTNTTGDAVFDEALRQGLRAELEQSPFLNLLSDQHVAEELRLMARPSDEHLTSALAQDLCQRVGSKAVVAGSISSLGSHYVISLNAAACTTGEQLATEQSEAPDKEHVLAALGASADKMRKKLGESLASIQKFDVPIEQVTTSSLEALRAYSVGMKYMIEYKHREALPHLQQAVALDPNFASAYMQLAREGQFLGRHNFYLENIAKAYALRDRASQRERFHITLRYIDATGGSFDTQRSMAELWAETYPRDDWPRLILTDIAMWRADWEEAVTQGRIALDLDPNYTVNYFNLAVSELALGRIYDAAATCDRAASRNIKDWTLPLVRYWIAFVRRDQEAMDKQIKILGDQVLQNPESEPDLIKAQMATALYFGKLDRARDFFQRAIGSVSHNGSTDDAFNAVGLYAFWGLVNAELGNTKDARTYALRAFRQHTDPEVGARLALACARSGEIIVAERSLTEFEVKFHSGSFASNHSLPVAHAAIALGRGDAGKAVELLRRVRGDGPWWGPNDPSSLDGLLSAYLSGQAFLQLHQGVEAAAEFERLINHPGIVVNSPFGPLARVGLARAHVLQGDTANARAAYQDFLTLWKDADPDIPILKQAKAEYAKLQ